MAEGGTQRLSHISAASSGPDEVCLGDRSCRSESRRRQTDEGLDAGVYEIAVAYRSDAFRAVYALKMGADIWVVHAFQKRSKRGIKTPKHEIDLIRDRIKRLKEMLK